MATLFTKIINREIPATIEYEDDEFLAFRDIHPGAPVHVLLVPKKEYATLEEVSADDADFHAKLLMTGRKVAKKLGIEKNYRLIMNVGPDMQQVPHLHLHIMGGWDEQDMSEKRKE
ncbi:MAG: histidine triad nucleotide-binding protein [Candidatus Woesebacteria bacterium]